MNIYVLVEGEQTEKKVYEKWIRYVNPNLNFVNDISDVQQNNYVIYAGFGYPFYLEVIENAIEDINACGNFDRLVISVDSEDMDYLDKYAEISNHVDGKFCNATIFIVIQHFCIETWALGNRVLISRNPQNELLRDYLEFFNVVDSDPELLPPYTKEELNRSQFAYKYLKKAVNEKYRELTYSKSNPRVLLNRKYFSRVKSRFNDSGHIASFENFLYAFQDNP